MKNKTLMKICAGLLTVAMMGTLVACGGDSGSSSSSDSSTPGSSSAENSSSSAETPSSDDTPVEETYDFGGQVVKVYGGAFNKLDPDSQDDDAPAWVAAAEAVEKEYNIDIQWTKPEGYDGYNLDEVLVNSINAGAGAVNILSSDPDAIMTFIGDDKIVDLTDEIDKLEIGSVYTEGATWLGRCYGASFDDIGDVYAIVYDRGYLEEIGMEKTPTDMFMEGKWSYDDVLEYCAELKSKLPEGVYPFGIHYYHWAAMAGAANGGVPSVSSDGVIGLADQNYIDAMEFYKTLLERGYAYPVQFGHDEESGDINDDGPQDFYGTGNLNTNFVMTRAEAWEFSSIQSNTNDNWGLVLWPWGDSVTCNGDYTTLSDNYKTAQAYWSPTVIMSDAEAQTGIPAITLMQIARDYYYAGSPEREEVIHGAWVSEQAGETPTIGFSAGTPRNFSTQEDMELYDWAHTRVIYDWAKPFDDAGITDTWMNAAYVMDGWDARSVAENYVSQGEAEMTKRGLK